MTNERIIKLEQLSTHLYVPNCNQDILNYYQQAQQYYLENLDNSEELFQSLINTEEKYFKFWLLETLIQIVGQKYSNMTKLIKDKFRKAILSLLEYEKLFSETFIINRYCFLFNKFILFDFPENNNTVFNDILSNIMNSKDDKQKILKLLIFLQILNTFNDEFIQYRHTYDEIQTNRSTIIKDYMRNNVIPNIVFVIKSILENEEHITNKLLINKSIIIISQLIDWNTLDNFNSVIDIILGQLIQQYKYFSPCMDIIYAMVKKGMEPNIKRKLIYEINNMLHKIIKYNKKIEDYTLQKIADIINLIGNFIIENFNYTKELIQKSDNNINDEIHTSFNWSCEELRYYFYFLKEIIFYFNSIQYKMALVLCESFEQIILYLKANDIIFEKYQYIIDSFKEVFPLIQNSLKLPKDFDFSEDNKINEEDDIFLLRREFGLIFKNCYNIKKLREYIIDSVLKILNTYLNMENNQNVKLNENKYNIEYCLYLMSILLESLNQNDLNNKEYNIGGKLTKIYDIMFQYPFTKIQNAEFIILSYYENVNKSLANIINNQVALEYILKLYVSDQGLFYKGKNFFILKILNNFDRFLTKIKTGKTKINYYDITNTIKESLKQLINLTKSTKNFELFKSYNLLFHSYGLMINFEDKKDIIKYHYNEAIGLLKYMISELIDVNNKGCNEDIFILILNNIIQFIQTISNGQMKIIDKNEMSNFLNSLIGEYCLKLINNNNSLIFKYINLLQRMIIILGIDSLKYLEHFFSNYLNQITILESIKLFYNAINSLKKGAINLTKNIFNMFFIIISKLPIPKDNISEENKAILNIISEFGKVINGIFIELPEVFFENDGVNNLNFNDLLNYIFNIGININDSQFRKTSIKIINNLCTYMKKSKVNFQNLPNLQNFIEYILNGIYQIYSKSNKKEVNDISSIVEIAKINDSLMAFENIYNNYYSKYLNQSEFNQFITILKSVDLRKIKLPDNIISIFDYIAKKVVNC